MDALLIPGVGPSGSPWIRTSAGAGIRPNMSISGSSSRSGARMRSASASSARTAPSIITRLRPRIGSGISGSGGSCRMRNDVVTSSGASSDQAAQRVRTRSAWRPVPGQHAAVGGGDRVELELELRDDAEVAAAAAQGPEDVRVGGRHRPSGSVRRR